MFPVFPDATQRTTGVLQSSVKDLCLEFGRERVNPTILTPCLLAAKLSQIVRNWEITGSYKGVLGGQGRLCWESWAGAQVWLGFRKG